LSRLVFQWLALDLLGYGFRLQIGGFEREGFLQILFGSGAVVVMEVGTGKDEVCLRAGLKGERGRGLVSCFGELPLVQ
jgi:hypothetical protein